jgi:hypothetical protein
MQWRFSDDEKGRMQSWAANNKCGPCGLREDVIRKMIRIARNDAGHPGIEQYLGRDHALVVLRLFPHFRDCTYHVICEPRQAPGRLSWR